MGSRYRSIILYHNKSQKEIAERVKKELNKANAFQSEIVTQIENHKNFYIAEEYHQDYFNKNPNVPYCSYVIKPKIEKFLLNK